MDYRWNCWLPVFEQLDDEYPDVDCATVDVDDNPELAQQLDIQSVPSFVAVEGGKIIEHRIGSQSKAELEELFKGD